MTRKLLLFVLVAHKCVVLVISYTRAECPDLPNYVESLPGLPDNVSVCNYAGSTFASPYFYWLMVGSSTSEGLRSPLVVVLGSGTESSFTQIFRPGGPYRLAKDGGTINVKLSESLATVANILYIEQPALFSFSKERFDGDYTTTIFLNELLRFLDSFFEYNPLVPSEALYVIAEGYMAKIGAMLGNPSYTKNRKYKIKGLIVHNGIYDLSQQMRSLSNLATTLHLASQDTLARLQEELGFSEETLRDNPMAAYQNWIKFVSLLRDIVGLPRFPDDFTDTSAEDLAHDIEAYLSRPDVQRSLHFRGQTEWKRTPSLPILQRALPALINSSTHEFEEMLDAPNHANIMFAVGALASRSSVDSFQSWHSTLEWRNKSQLQGARRVFVAGINSAVYVKEADRVVYAIYVDEGRVLGESALPTYLFTISQFIETLALKGPKEDDSRLHELLFLCNQRGRYNSTTMSCDCDKSSTELFYGTDCSFTVKAIAETQSFDLAPGASHYFALNLTDGATHYSLSAEPLDNNRRSLPSPLVVVVKAGLESLPTVKDCDLYSKQEALVIDGELKGQGDRGGLLGVLNPDLHETFRVRLTVAPLVGPSKGLWVILTVVLAAVLLVMAVGFVILWRCQGKSRGCKKATESV